MRLQPGAEGTAHRGPSDANARGRSCSLTPDEFRALGHQLVDRIADFLGSLAARRVAQGETPDELRGYLGRAPLAEVGLDPGAVLNRAADLVFEHSVLTSHPRYWAYIHGSADPIGALGDLVASSVNSPVTSWRTGPISSAIEEQAITWLAELIGYPPNGTGVLLSGGSAANMAGVVAALRARAPWDVRQAGLASAGGERIRIYAGDEAHSSVTEAVELCGLGARAVTRVRSDAAHRMDADDLTARIAEDVAAGLLPLILVATAGTTSTGAVDPLPELAAIAAQHGLWFHVDGAYGAVAAYSPDAPPDLMGLAHADSIVVDPHKWLHVPLEAACLLTRHRHVLYEAFRCRALYYSQSDPGLASESTAIPFRDQSPQTSRDFKALKVWLVLQQWGREGYSRPSPGACQRV